MRLLKSLMLGVFATLGATSVVSAQQVCPQCGRVHGYSQPARSGFQALAEAEARVMAARSYKGHTQSPPAGVGFCGVGWSSSSTPSTCTPSRGMTLLADAVVRGRDGWYRVRYWR